MAASFAQVMEGSFRAFLTRAVRQVEASEPWPNIEAAALADAGPAQAKALGAWLAEDALAQGPPKGAADAPAMRARAEAADRAVAGVVARIAAAPVGGLAPAAQEAREVLSEVFSGELDRISEALQEGFGKASGSPLIPLRRGLSLGDVLPEGARNERVRFAKAATPPPGLALEPVAHLRQDVARLKHYALHDAAAGGGRAHSIASSSTYFRSIRPPVSLDGDLSEFRAMSGIANAADAWGEAARRGLIGGFLERLKARQGTALLGSSGDPAAVVRALEIERAAADLEGALEGDPGAAIIPAEGLLALVVEAGWGEGGGTA